MLLGAVNGGKKVQHPEQDEGATGAAGGKETTLMLTAIMAHISWKVLKVCPVMSLSLLGFDINQCF